MKDTKSWILDAAAILFTQNGFTKTTTKAIAELAGVSKSTVSRVINNSGSIKESTRRRVEEAMEQLNYAPSYLAQGIRTRKTKTIALMVPESSNLFYNELLYGVEVKFYNMEVEIDENLESPLKGLYIIGDGSGVTHSLSHASASGIYVARQIAEEI